MERYLPPPTITDLTLSGSVSGSTTSSFANVAILRFEGGASLISSSLEPNAMIVDLSSLSNSGSWDGSFTGSAGISGSLIVTGSTSLEFLTASGIPYPTSIGAEGEAIVVGPNDNLIFAYPKAITERVKNVSGDLLPKGTPVHATGSGTSGNIVGVITADAGNPSLMPATYVLNEDLDDGEEGEALVTGFIQGVDTRGLIEGEPVYVGVGGGWVQTKPTGSALIQNLGIVTKVGQNGSGVVLGAGRSNDVPNLPPGYAWVGNGDWVATAVPSSSFSKDPFPYTGSAEISGSLEVLDGNISTNRGLYLGPSNTSFIRSSDLGHEILFANRAHWKKGNAYISSRGGQWILSGNGIAEPNDYGQAFVHITKNGSISKKAFSLDYSSNGLKTTFDVNVSGSLIIDSEGDVFINDNTTISGNVNIPSGSLTVSSSVSASTYYGDISNLTGTINGGTF